MRVSDDERQTESRQRMMSGVLEQEKAQELHERKYAWKGRCLIDLANDIKKHIQDSP